MEVNGHPPREVPPEEEVVDPEEVEVAYLRGREARRRGRVKQSPYVRGSLRISWLDGYESEEEGA